MNDKKQIDELIDRLADKSLSFGCRVGVNFPDVRQSDGSQEFSFGIYICELDGRHFVLCGQFVEECDIDSLEILGHPILIGDVLERMENCIAHCERLLYLWQPLGFTKSLQEIIQESGWEEVYEFSGDGQKKYRSYEGETLKDPNARALLDFLIEIGL